MFGAIHAYGSSIEDQIYAAKTMVALNPLKNPAMSSGDFMFDLWGRQKQAISKGTPLTNPAGGGGGGGAGGGGGGGAGGGGGGGAPVPVTPVPAPAAFPSAADVQKFAQCIRIAGELLEQHQALGGNFAALDTTTNPGLSVVTITDANVTTAIGTPRKSYNLGTLGKQPADHGKKGKRAAMTSAEKKRHKDLADRKNGRHNKVMQDKKAPHKKAAARGSKKAGNVKAQAVQTARKVS